MKPITLDEYKEAGEEFWPKYDYVAQNIGEGAKTEDILKVMETLAGIVMKKRVDDKLAPFGFFKKTNDGTDTATAEESNNS
jgi:hypothetical protein